MFARERELMVEQQLLARGIIDFATLNAMREVPRHLFVPRSQGARSYGNNLPETYAYEDCALPIGEGQTISRPYYVALMIQAARLRPNACVLEVGTGSGYVAAVLSRIVAKVYTIERIPVLAEQASARLQFLGYHNVHVSVGDGSLGLAEMAPFDAIIVAAGAPDVPLSLQQQLAVGGTLLIPVGDAGFQELVCMTKVSEGCYTRDVIELVRFVPLIGSEGWYSRLRR